MKAKKAISSLPFASTVTDSLDLMRRVWGAAGMPTPGGVAQFAAGLPGALPSMITPTLDVAELDKRIADLRAVEQWLNLNAQLLRTSIQTLEVQRNTIATLKSIGGAVLGPVTGSTPAPAADAPPQRPKGSFRAPGSAGPFVVAPPPAPAAPPAQPQPARRARKASRSPGQAVGALEAPFSPAAWWHTLQDQFQKVAAAAAADAAAGRSGTAGRDKGASGAVRRSARGAAGPGTGRRAKDRR